MGAASGVAVGRSGTILTSTNGTSWSAVPSGTSNNLYGAAYGGGRWVAVGYDTILTSTNGTSGWWTPVVWSFYGAAYGGGRWVAVGRSGVIFTSTSTLGYGWREATSGTSQSLLGAAYGGGRWVAVGGNTIVTSQNGTSWW